MIECVGGMIMENTFNQNKYKGVLNVVHIILKVLMIILFVGLGIMAIGFATILFIPKGLLEIDLAALSDLNTRLTAIMLEIDPNFFTGTVNIKRSLLAILLTGLANAAFLQFIFIYLKKLIKNVKESQIFEKGNAKILKTLGIGFLVASVILPVFSSISMLSVANMLDIFQDVHYSFSIHWQSVFTGVLILILAYVFSYGTYLQEEHDLTV